MSKRAKATSRLSLWLLGACYFISITITFMHVASTNIASKGIVTAAGFSSGLATVPLSVLLVNSALSIAPAGWLFKRFAYRRTFIAGATCAVVGGALCSAAQCLRGASAFALFCVGVIPSGLSLGIVNYYRHVAALIGGNDEALRAQNVAIVITGAALAGVTGSGLATLTKDLIADHTFAGVYLTAAMLSVVHCIILFFIDVEAAEDEVIVGGRAPAAPLKRARSMWHIMRQLDFAIAVANGTVATCMMVLVMGITPLVLNAQGIRFLFSAIVIATHVTCMYLPSFLTSALIRRFSAASLFVPGALVSGVGVLFYTYNASAGDDERWRNFALTLAGLCVVGVGWNASFVAATTLLGTTYLPAEKFKAQALNDTVIWSLNALATLASGFLLQHVGRVAIVVGAVCAYAGLLALNSIYLVTERRKRLSVVKLAVSTASGDDGEEKERLAESNVNSEFTTTT